MSFNLDVDEPVEPRDQWEAEAATKSTPFALPSLVMSVVGLLGVLGSGAMVLHTFASNPDITKGSLGWLVFVLLVVGGLVSIAGFVFALIGYSKDEHTRRESLFIKLAIVFAVLGFLVGIADIVGVVYFFIDLGVTNFSNLIRD
jgi:uncharacterized membrane protein YhaH (DUF805 family)